MLIYCYYSKYVLLLPLSCLFVIRCERSLIQVQDSLINCNGVTNKGFIHTKVALVEGLYGEQDSTFFATIVSTAPHSKWSTYGDYSAQVSVAQLILLDRRIKLSEVNLWS